MTSKLKCPVCQNNLRKLFNRYTGEPNCDYECGNFDCELYGIEIPESVWKAGIQKLEDLKTIRAKLEIARCALKDIVFCKQFDSVIAVRKYADKALEQIENKEQK